METTKKKRVLPFTTTIVVVIVVCSLIFVGFLSYRIGYSDSATKINDLQNQISILQGEISNIEASSVRMVITCRPPSSFSP